jgi:drug/metabolite transporter (DMT)-like permease
MTRTATEGVLVTQQAVLSFPVRQRALFGILCFVWGTTWLGMKVGIAVVPPGVFSGTRWTVAGLTLLLWRWARGQRLMIPMRLTGRLVIVAILMVSLNQVIQLYGLRYITAGLACVLSSALTPIALLGFAVAWGQERFAWRQLVALGIGIAGVVVLFGPAAVAGNLDVWEVLGAAGVIIGTMCYSAGSVMARPLMNSLAPAQMAAMTNLIGGVLLLVSSIIFEPGAAAALVHPWGWRAAIAWLYLLIPGSLLSTVIYFLLVRDWGASRTGTYAFVSPVVAVVIGTSLFGEKLDLGDVIGMMLMLAAAAIVLRRPIAP